MSGPLPRRRAPLPRTRARLSSTVRPAPPFWSHRPCPTHTIKSLSSSIENLVFCIFLSTVQVTFLSQAEISERNESFVCRAGDGHLRRGCGETLRPQGFLGSQLLTFLPSREGSFGGAGAGLELQDSCARL